MSETEMGLWEVGAPNPYDLSQPWQDTGPDFATRDEAVAWVRDTLGGDAQGRIGLVSKLPGGEGWAVDFPDPSAPGGPWVSFDVWPTKREAVKYLKDTVGADPQGRISLIFPPPDEGGAGMSGADDLTEIRRRTLKIVRYDLDNWDGKPGPVTVWAVRSTTPGYEGDFAYAANEAEAADKLERLARGEEPYDVNHDPKYTPIAPRGRG